MKREDEYWERTFKIELVIMLILLTLFFLFGSGCGRTIPKPLKGGGATVEMRGVEKLELLQGENMQTPSSLEVLKINGAAWGVLTNLNSGSGEVVQYKIQLGEHQKDEVRSAWDAVEKTGVVLRSMQPLMYAGLVLIVVALGMSYFQAKYPTVFSPGLKVIALTFCAGLVLVTLPALTQDKTVMLSALIGSVLLVAGYIISKRFDK
jgi:hypothetical protein